jgi:hypothetical protein
VSSIGGTRAIYSVYLVYWRKTVENQPCNHTSTFVKRHRMPGSLLEQARRQAKGQIAERNDWKEVTVGENTFTMEYPLIVEGTPNRVNIEDISYTCA